MQKWEYCILYQGYEYNSEADIMIYTGVYYVSLLTASEPVLIDSIDDAQGHNISIAKLGLEGWELIGIESGVYYFKRPLIS